MADIDSIQAENLLLGLYEDTAVNADFDFFEHVGLPRDASWGQFRRHYDKDGLPDSERAAQDLRTYPPVAKQIAELKLQQDNPQFEPEDFEALLDVTKTKKH